VCTLDTKLSRNVDVADASRVPRAHRPYDVVVQERLPVQTAVMHKHPTFDRRVPHVVGLGAEE
jgi:hypothetical protein